MNGNHDCTSYCPWCYNVILNLGRFAAESLFAVSNLEYVNTQSKYQALLLGVAVLVLFATNVANGVNFAAFLGIFVSAPMAGLLSGSLAKSVVETNGIFWAWFIHSAFVMAAANKSLGRTRGADVPLAR